MYRSFYFFLKWIMYAKNNFRIMYRFFIDFLKPIMSRIFKNSFIYAIFHFFKKQGFGYTIMYPSFILEHLYVS